MAHLEEEDEYRRVLNDFMRRVEERQVYSVLQQH
jgi:hypothetical protein